MIIISDTIKEIKEMLVVANTASNTLKQILIRYNIPNPKSDELPLVVISPRGWGLTPIDANIPQAHLDFGLSIKIAGSQEVTNDGVNESHYEEMFKLQDFVVSTILSGYYHKMGLQSEIACEIQLGGDDTITGKEKNFLFTELIFSAKTRYFWKQPKLIK